MSAQVKAFRGHDADLGTIGDGYSNTRLSRELLSDWLCWAGARLVAMPMERIKPAAPRACWPDYGTDVFQILEFRRNARIRVPAPSKDEIPIMDEILLFPNLCSYVGRRRVLHLRLLTNPITLRPVYSWSKIAEKINTSAERSKRLHSAALEEVLFKLPASRVELVSRFFAETPVF